jgi:hypothetical protein
VEIAQYVLKVAGQPGVVQGVAQALRSSASAHVKPMGRKTSTQCRTAQAPHIACFTGTLQAMNHHNVASNRSSGVLRLHQHGNLGLGLVEPRLERISGFGAIPGPQVSGYGLEVRIAE